MKNLVKEKISTPRAPTALGPYSQAVGLGDFVFCSGQIPTIPETGLLEEADITLQCRRVMKNITAVLEAAGSHPSKIVKATVFLSDMKNFEAFNKEYEAFFTSIDEKIYPARSTFQVAALPKNALIEIEVIATR